MRRTLLSLLAVLLAIQIGITSLLYWPREAATETPGALLGDLTAEALERIVIHDDAAHSVTLLRGDAGWQIEPGALPVDATRVQTLLDALATPTDYPVATTASAQQRFEVAQDKFQRRILMEHAGGSHTVYLGSAPGFRKVHARRADEEAVYSIDFNTFDAPATANGWLERTLAQVEHPQQIRWTLDLPAEPTSDAAADAGASAGADTVTEADTQTEADVAEAEAAGESSVDRLANGKAAQSAEGGIYRSAEDWLLLDDSAADADAADTLLNALANLRVSGIAEAEPGHTELALRFEEANGPAELRLLRSAAQEESTAADRYLLRVAGYEPLFTLSSYDRDRLIEAITTLSAPPASGEPVVPLEPEEPEEP